MGGDVLPHDGRGLRYSVSYSFQNRRDPSGRAAHSSLPQTLKVFDAWPTGRAIQGESHAVFGQIDRCCHQIVDGSEPRFALNVVIDNAEIFQMRISIPQGAVESDEREETLRILDEMWRVRKLRETAS